MANTDRKLPQALTIKEVFTEDKQFFDKFRTDNIIHSNEAFSRIVKAFTQAPVAHESEDAATLLARITELETENQNLITVNEQLSSAIEVLQSRLQGRENELKEIIENPSVNLPSVIVNANEELIKRLLSIRQKAIKDGLVLCDENTSQEIYLSKIFIYSTIYLGVNEYPQEFKQ